MTASALNRKLLFSGYGEVTDFLRNSPLNRHIYKKVLGVLSASGIAVPVVTLFNEIYYQCVRVNYDGTPGVDFERRYWSEEEAWIGSADGTQLVFCVVWALLSGKPAFTFQEECFLSALVPHIKGSALRDFAEELSREIRSYGFSVPDRFPVMTCPVSELPIFTDKGGGPNRFWGLDDPAYITTEATRREVHDAWATVTCGFTHSVIGQYVRLYANQDDQLRLLSCMESALTQNEAKEHGAFFKDLALRITTGSFDPAEGLSLQPVGVSGVDADGREQLFSLDLEDGGDGSLGLARQYRQERDALKVQLEEMRKGHAMELARLEAKYRAEIKELMEENSKLFRRPSKRRSAPLNAAERSSDILMLNIQDVADHVKKRFSKSGGEEICTMLYRLAVEHGNLAEETFKLIDSIIPAIMARDHPHQTLNMSHVEQFNNNLGNP